MSSLYTSEYNVIYVVSRDSIEGALKIGKTTVKAYDPETLTPNCSELIEATKQRLAPLSTYGVTDIHILHTEIGWFINEQGKKLSIMDLDVHKVLKNSHYEKLEFPLLDNEPNEWYKVDLETAKKAIAAVKSEQEAIDGPVIQKKKRPEIHFRDEQELAISETQAHFIVGKKMLWNAKMRFGKTLCALELIRRENFNKTLILTHRPTVKKGWFEDYHNVKFENYEYGSKKGNKFATLADDDYVGKDIATLLKDTEEKQAGIIYFASMQDLRGSKNVSDKGINKNDEVFKTNWDLIILDEAHEGTQTPLGQNVIRELTHKKNPFLLYLSGTPYNLLEQFADEEIYTWDYVMEQQAKEEWPSKHPNEPNPYEGLAKLNIYTYNIGNAFELNNYSRSEDDYFNFAELFRTWTGDEQKDGAHMTESDEIDDFIHKQDVGLFLDLLCKEEPVSYYPYSNEDFRNALSHSLWMVPGVKQAKALEKMINDHPLHKNWGFVVVNVAGNETYDEDDPAKDKNIKDALDKVQNAVINNKRTITLSCGRLTTGVSVPEWTGVFMLSGGYSTGAASYMQTIFRSQTPYKNGAVKSNCYAFDFAPDRTLTVIDDYINMQRSSRNQKRDDSTKGYYMQNLLRFCPVIAMEGGKETPYDAQMLVKEVNEVYAEKVISSGFKKGLSKSFANFTEEDHKLLAAIGALINTGKGSTSKDGRIKITDEGLKGDEGKKPKSGKKKAGKKGNPPGTKPRNEEAEKRKRSQQVLEEIFIRFPLLLFGSVTDPSGLSLNQLVEEFIDDESWEEFMPRRFTKAMMLQIAHLVKIDVLISSAAKIIEEAKAADNLTIEERVMKMASMISRFHFPDNETILTPWFVVNLHISSTLGGYDFYNEQHSALIKEPRWVDRGAVTKDVFEPADTKLLEINSKSGVYPLYLAYTLYRKRCEKIAAKTNEEKLKVWDRVLEDNLFVLCKTTMAKKITERVLRGYRDAVTHCEVYPNLVPILRSKKKESQQKLIKNLQSTKFWKTNSIKNMKLKFNAIVGNPPYQLTVAQKETENGQKAVVNIFHHFQNISDEMGKYVSLIYPGARWIHRSGKGLGDFGKKQINDPRLKLLYFYPNANEIFKDAGIADGISIVLKDIQKNENGFLYVYAENGVCQEVPMDNPGEKLMPLNPADASIVSSIEKVVYANKIKMLHEAVLARSLFSIESNFVENNPTLVREYNEGDAFDPETEIKLFTNDKAGKSGRARWYVAGKDVITTGTEYLNKWKVVVSSANAGGQKRSNQIAILDNHSAFGRARVALKTFDTEKEAQNFFAYAQSKLIRFAFLMTDESLTSLALKVPDILDYSDKNKFIDFSKDIDEQLYKLFKISPVEQKHIEDVLAKKTE